MSKVIHSAQEMIELRKSLKGSVGFVPTMGALHAGHESLLKKSRAENDISILSIFVNPTQFNDPKDFEIYPKTWNEDVQIAEKNGVDYIFSPEYASLYPDNYTYKVSENTFSRELCGAHRPGHFDGVLTVVLKLFQIVKPQKTYFGEKDHQQLTLIKNMVSAFFLPLEVIPCPTLRESSGLAMSSRNTRLSAAGKVKAAEIYKALTTIKDISAAKKHLEDLGFEMDYLEDRNGRRYVAAFLEGVRLIDNVSL